MNKSREGIVWGLLTKEEQEYIKASKEVETFNGKTWAKSTFDDIGCLEHVAYRRKPEVESVASIDHTNCIDCFYNHPDKDVCTAPKDLIQNSKDYECYTSAPKKLPTLPDYIKEHGWPDWAKYAMVTKNSDGLWEKNKPELSDTESGWINHSGRSAFLDVKLDATNWQNSLVEKCDTCNGIGLVGIDMVRVRCSACNGTKIKPKQEPKKRVPLTAKDFQNIRGLIGKLELQSMIENRILSICSGSIIIMHDADLFLSIPYTTLAKSDTLRGITFDNKIVPLYKEE